MDECCENQILVKQQNSKREHMRWIKDHTLAPPYKTVTLPGWPLWLISPEVDMSHGGTGKQGQRDEKVQNWKDHLWRVWWATHGGEKSNWSQLERSARKIGPVPRQNYFPSRWRIGKKLHCFCDTARAFKSLPSKHTWLTTFFALLLFNSINLPHGPLEAIMISPPPSTGLPHHPQKEARRKNFLLTTRLLCKHVGRWRARWLVSNWRLARSTPTQRASPAFHWENSCSPSFLPSPLNYITYRFIVCVCYHIS